MKALDYIFQGMESRVIYDEAGNLYIDNVNLAYEQSDELDTIIIITMYAYLIIG